MRAKIKKRLKAHHSRKTLHAHIPGLKGKLLRFIHRYPVSVGILILVASFALEKWSDHYLWAAMIETSRAAGVVPLWDSISNFFNLYKP